MAETISSNVQGGSASAAAAAADGEKELEFASELMGRGLKAAKEGDYTYAADCYSRALEIRYLTECICPCYKCLNFESSDIECGRRENGGLICSKLVRKGYYKIRRKVDLEHNLGVGEFFFLLRVAHYGELAPECVHAYYKYGCALLYKAQDEADPLGTMPNKDGESHTDDKDGAMKNGLSGESSVTSAFSNTEEKGTSKLPEAAPEEASSGKDQEAGEESDDDELDEADEDESDLDLAWKMLDLARAIVEKNPGDTMEKVDILSTLAEVALEREDIETSLSDYLKALGILERLVEPHDRRIAELNFRICLCLEIGSKAEEAIPYCQTAILICKSRVQRLSNELKSSTGSTTSAASELDQTIELPSSGSPSGDDVVEKEEEIKTLTELFSDLEKKLEDLQQLVANPTSVLSDILAMVSAKARTGDSHVPPVMYSSQLGVVASSNFDLDSPTVSTAHTNGTAPMTHLGVVGRGVKRVLMSTVASEPVPTKKLELEPTAAKDDKGS